MHVDADRFFLAVHEREDPTLRDQPAALWQYNHVVCASHDARALGVTKRMGPEAADKLLRPAGGRLLHAYSRQWPGPRVCYARYNAASRELFAALRAAMDEYAPGSVLERASIDEAYVELTDAALGGADGAGRAAAAEAAAAAIARRIRERARLPVSVGLARTKALAKLASSAVKPSAQTPSERAAVRAVWTGAEEEVLLQQSAPTKLPPLSGRGESLAALGVRTALELRTRWPSARALGAALGLSPDAAELLWRRVHGSDEQPVREVRPQSVSVTSWSGHCTLGALVRRAADGDACGGDGEGAVCVGTGRWRFVGHSHAHAHRQRGAHELHLLAATPGLSGSALDRCKWIVLALSADLAERVADDARAHARLPTKLAVGVHGPGTRLEPGPGYTDGHTRSRTCAFPRAPFALAAAGVADVPELAADGPSLLDDAVRGPRIGALVDAVCRVLEQWARAEPAKRAAQLTLTASSFCAVERPRAHPAAVASPRAELAARSQTPTAAGDLGRPITGRVSSAPAEQRDGGLGSAEAVRRPPPAAALLKKGNAVRPTPTAKRQRCISDFFIHHHQSQ